MDRREAIEWLKDIKESEVLTDWSYDVALNLAIEALKGDLHCPKCGTIVRDGRQYHDLVYRGEAEPKETQGERMTRIVHELSGCVAESATTTDCISRKQAIEAIGKGIERILENPCVMTEGDFHFQNALKLAQEIIELQPPVNQKQITGKLESVENATSEGEESTTGQPKSKLDCISRQQAINAVENTNINITESEWDELINAIDNLPPVTPTERTGEWIEDEEQHHVERTYHCSECGFGAWGEYEKTRWCGGCGAKMGGCGIMCENILEGTSKERPKNAIEILDECGISYSKDTEWDNGKSLMELRDAFFTYLKDEFSMGGDTE